MVAALEIARNLKGMSFPANRDRLFDRAKENNAPGEVMDGLRQLPDKEYRSMADVFLGLKMSAPSRWKGRVPAHEIAHYLKGISFPANRDRLIDHAKEKNASDQVIDSLNQLPDKEYMSMADVFLGLKMETPAAAPAAAA